MDKRDQIILQSDMQQLLANAVSKLTFLDGLVRMGETFEEFSYIVDELTFTFITYLAAEDHVKGVSYVECEATSCAVVTIMQTCYNLNNPRKWTIGKLTKKLLLELADGKLIHPLDDEMTQLKDRWEFWDALARLFYALPAAGYQPNLTKVSLTVQEIMRQKFPERFEAWKAEKQRDRCCGQAVN